MEPETRGVKGPGTWVTENSMDMGSSFRCLTESFQADRNPRERGSRPLNSSRWRGASRPANGPGVDVRPVAGASAGQQVVRADQSLLPPHASVRTLEGLAGQLLGLLWIAAWIPDWGVPLFWKFLGLPVGILALLAGWQMFRLYRLLSMSLRSIQLSIVSEVAERTRLVLIYTGVMMLLFIFIIGGEIFWSPSMFG